MRLCAFLPTHETNEIDRRPFRKFRCTRCDYTSVLIPDEGQAIYRTCDKQGGIGDTLARWLSCIGITKPRMVAVFGGCDCDERKETLNQVGWEIADRWKWLFGGRP